MGRIYRRSLLLAIAVLAVHALHCGGGSCENDGCDFKSCRLASSQIDAGPIVDLAGPPPDLRDPQCPQQASPGEFCQRPSKICVYVDLALFCEGNIWVIDCAKSAPKWCADLGPPDLSIDAAPDDAAEPPDGPLDGTDDAGD